MRFHLDSKNQSSSSLTIYYFVDQAYFELPREHDVNRKKKMFEMARMGFEQILIPSKENSQLISIAHQEFQSGSKRADEYVGVHIRR